ncbi:MAG: type II secretion system major pseudopilin GspG [Myxococcales bacterium]|nr:type II secretion system major pseudopilin GspG [Myxococcales bacterium]
MSIVNKANSPAQSRRNRRGLTLIEILVVVAILGIIAGVVGVNVFDQMAEAQVDLTRTQIKNIGDALEIYKMKIGKYPNSAEGLEVLANPPKGRKAMMQTIPRDPWGEAFIYTNPAQHNTGRFDIFSKGPDQQSGTDDDITNWTR